MGQEPLNKKAYQIIKDWIVQYQLKPGSLISGKQLAESLGMSQTPVREALAILEHEHLIDSVAKKGYRIKAQGIHEIGNLYDVRIAVEVMAAEKAAISMSPRDHERLANVIDQFPDLIALDNKAQFLELEQRFHIIIMEAAGNPRLSEIGRDILARIWMVQKIVFFNSKHWGESLKQHEGIAHLLKANDSDRAAALMKQHLEWGKELILERMADKDDYMASVITGHPEVQMDFGG